MELNPKEIEFMMGLAKDEEAVVACKSKITLQSAANICEYAKWNAIRYLNGIEHLLRSCCTRNASQFLTEGWNLTTLPCLSMLISEVRNDGI
jgi:hypothetical protein